MTLTGNYDAVILLGCIVRGETSQFDLLGRGIYDGISHLMTFKETPIVCGVLTTETMEQAIARSQHGPLNRGAESAVEAIKMAKF